MRGKRENILAATGDKSVVHLNVRSPIIPEFEKHRQEDKEFKVSSDYTVSFRPLWVTRDSISLKEEEERKRKSSYYPYYLVETNFFMF